MGRGKQGKEGKGSSQGRCIKDPWTETSGVGEGLNVGVGVGRAGDSNGGKWGQL